MLAVVDCRIPDSVASGLIALGYHPLRLPPHPSLPTPIASHPDMLLFFAPDAILCTVSYARIAHKELQQISMHLQKPIVTIDEDYGSMYPHDVLLNAAVVGRHLLCNPKSVSATPLSIYAESIVAVRQGYTKCATLPVGKNALITADPSIATAAGRFGIEVLQIAQGAIRLVGYDYGFIGGCASFSPYKTTDTIFFCGDVSLHPNAESIRDFCIRHGYRTHSLGKDPLTDVGTLFLI